MKTTLRFYLGALALVPAWINLRADEPAPSSVTGHVLILDSERTVEGDIEREGDYYHVKRSFGETIWPAAKVVRLCADLPEAYAYLRSQANLDDPDERLRLAQWCHLRGLREQALKDVQAAAELRPGNAKTQRLLEHLQRPQ